ncbi:hypothetical protein [Natronosalvus rutilus]|uniref:Uncharacterized protein n=1 Tax=Natronosalvus rutilus TaxID=2953753 RepID=A0A9E7N8S6_9EURY|nr:hypothetical protein [Natronosalvus rutilus]UTF52956.1 hypothetical protein NGM29_14395 [Natronosalvus rutilus]
METLAACFERERRSERPALEDATGRTYDAHWLRTSAWKAGNFLRHTGVRRGVTVGVVGSGPLALLSFFGTALLESRTRFDPPHDLGGSEDLRTLVAPVSNLGEYALPEGAQRVGYGERPDDPGVRHLESGLWSENPSFPPLEVDPETPLLVDGRREYSHRSVLEAATDVVDEWGLETGDRVALRAPLSDPRAVVGGVVAPLLVDAVTVLSDPDSDSNSEPPVDDVGADVDFVVTTEDDRSRTASPEQSLSAIQLE